MRTYIAIVLDKSGSMAAVKDVTISGFNEQVQAIASSAQASEANKQTFVSLVTFNHKVDTQFWNQPVDMLHQIGAKDYRPDGSTAMLDAIGYTIDRLCEDTNIFDMQNRYLLLVMTDGYENASSRFAWGLIADKINSLKKSDRWTVTLLGANVDIEKMAADLSLDRGNVQSYQGTNIGTREAFTSMRCATTTYMSTSDTTASTSFYAGNNEEDSEE